MRGMSRDIEMQLSSCSFDKPLPPRPGLPPLRGKAQDLLRSKSSTEGTPITRPAHRSLSPPPPFLLPPKQECKCPLRLTAFATAGSSGKLLRGGARFEGLPRQGTDDPMSDELREHREVLRQLRNLFRFGFLALLLALGGTAVWIWMHDATGLPVRLAEQYPTDSRGSTGIPNTLEYSTANDGASRRESDPAAVSQPPPTTMPESFAILGDLIAMPMEVIDSVTQLTFMTSDGALHSYPKYGVLLERGEPPEASAKSTLTYFTPVKDLTVVVRGDGSAVLRRSGSSDMKIVMPARADQERRLRTLHEQDADLVRRCHPTAGVCLYTRGELFHLHGLADAADRRLQQSRAPTGLAYASLNADIYALSSDTGFVMWDAIRGSVVSQPVDPEPLPDEPASQFDAYGCLVEEGFDTRAFPLTTKHCYLWRYTSH
eukprot:scaffold233_cov243-Pinguiococcus_pyrenoidosus.AAC.1